MLGIDVSGHQGNVDWPAVAGDGIDFAYVKATEGSDFVDDQVAANIEGAHRAGLEVGAYHFFSLCSPGRSQAENFLRTVNDPQDLPPALDLEIDGNCSRRPPRATVQRDIGEFIDAVEEAWHQDVVLYLAPEFDDLYGVSGRFERPLWVHSIMRRPAGPWAFWQASWFARVDGIDGRVDLDVRAPAGRG